MIINSELLLQFRDLYANRPIVVNVELYEGEFTGTETFDSVSYRQLHFLAFDLPQDSVQHLLSVLPALIYRVARGDFLEWTMVFTCLAEFLHGKKQENSIEFIEAINDVVGHNEELFIDLLTGILDESNWDDYDGSLALGVGRLKDLIAFKSDYIK